MTPLCWRLIDTEAKEVLHEGQSEQAILEWVDNEQRNGRMKFSDRAVIVAAPGLLVGRLLG